VKSAIAPSKEPKSIITIHQFTELPLRLPPCWRSAPQSQQARPVRVVVERVTIRQPHLGHPMARHLGFQPNPKRKTACPTHATAELRGQGSPQTFHLRVSRDTIWLPRLTEAWRQSESPGFSVPAIGNREVPCQSSAL
jgi:hypothetical protein